METFANDTKYVMSKIGMNDQDFEHHEHKSVGDSTRDLALELFAKLPKKPHYASRRTKTNFAFTPN